MGILIIKNEKLSKVFVKISYTNKDITIKMRIYTLYTCMGILIMENEKLSKAFVKISYTIKENKIWGSNKYSIKNLSS